MEIGNNWRGWSVEALIGAGIYSKVYKVKCKNWGVSYESALKVIQLPGYDEMGSAKRNDFSFSDDEIECYYQEKLNHYIEIMRLSDEIKGNPNVLSYDEYDVIDNGTGYEVCLRMELLTSLPDYLMNHSLTEEDILQLGIDVCKALETCHYHGYVHRGVKPHNIFISNQCGYKLGDLDGAIKTNSKDTSEEYKYASFFMPPEWHSSDRYNENLDIYSLGMILYTLLNNNRMPFMPSYPERVSNSDKQKANERRFKGDIVPPPCNANEALGNIVIKALAFRPEDRYQNSESMRIELETVLGKAKRTTDDSVCDKDYEAEMLFCPYCRTENPATNTFCRGCGCRFQEIFIDPEDTVTICPNCEEVNLAEYRYCMKCGADLRIN